MSLTRIIHKTPLVNDKSNVYDLDHIDSKVISTILQSRFIGDGVFGIEQYSIDDYKEQYLYSPSFEKFPLPYSDKQWNFNDDIKDVDIYELLLDKPSFMPLDVNQFLDILNINFPSSVFMQILICKRTDTSWRENSINAYQSFLKGNDTPLEGKFAIRLQENILNVFNKIGNFTSERKQIDEMEQKILSNNYRFECRLIVFNAKNAEKYVLELQKTLQKLQLFNEITIKRTRNKKNTLKLIENREFTVDSVHQLLSESEIYSLLCSDRPSTVTKVELEKPVQKQSISNTIKNSVLLQQAIQLMPKGENNNIEVDESKAQLINQALKRVGVINKPLKISEVHQGSTLLKVQMIVPPDITYTTITKKLTDIKAALGNEGISIEIGDKADTINVFVPLENRGVLYFRDILESDEFIAHKEKYPLPFVIGENVNGGLMFSDLAELRHLLITGATGSGKSVFVNLLLLSLILSVPPDELMLYLVDPKQVEYTFFKGFPQVQEVITDMKKADSLLASLENEMENRYTLFAKNGVKTIATYNKNNSDNKIPYLVVSIDEYADLVMVNPKVEDYLVRLGQKARSAGIHLIICTQKPLSDIVTSVLKSNLPSAISFRLKTSSDYMTVFGKGIPYNLLGKGDGVAKLEGQMKEYERFQSPILTTVEEDEEDIYTELKELFKDVVVSSRKLEEVKIKEPIDKLKRMIASTNELRVSELGRLMGIGNNKVHALIQVLVEEEWLRKEGRGYVINVDREEYEKWRSEINE